MYEVHLRGWNSGISVATIYKSDDLKECEDFSDKWNKFTDELYKGKCMDDIYVFYADIYDTENNKYVHGL